MPQLAETQRRFFSALQVPLRGASRRSTELPASAEPHDPAFLATADDLLRPSPTLVPAECLELYHRQYWFRLLDSIADDFPGLKTFLGEEPFWELLENFLLAHPSTSFTLRHLGRHMPDFLENSISEPVRRQRAIAIARIEWARMECFEAADRPVASPEQVAAERFTLQAHVRLLTSAANASSWLSDPSSAWDEAGIYHTAVWRTREGTTQHRPLADGEFEMLKRLHEIFWSLDDWLKACEQFIPGPSTLSDWFSRWQAEGWFTTESFSTRSNTDYQA